MSCSKIQVLKNSILTFQSTVKVSTTSLTTDKVCLRFTDILQDGLIFVNSHLTSIVNVGSVEVWYSTDYEATPYKQLEILKNYDRNLIINYFINLSTDNELIVYILPSGIEIMKQADSLCRSIFIKITFKAQVNNLTTLGKTLDNKGVFTLVEMPNITSPPIIPISKNAKVQLSMPYIDHYSPMVLGYSISVYRPASTFNAKLCFNALNGAYGDDTNPGVLVDTCYILTIKPTAGLTFPTPSKKGVATIPKIHIYADCFLPNGTNELTALNITYKVVQGNLQITIPYTDSVNTNQYISLSGKFISVNIPYNINDYNLYTNKNTYIEGSIKFINNSNPKDPVTLASLNHFRLCVNFEYPELMGVSEIIFC
ncbi:MAG: hypothetical protein Q4B63_08425 [Clostridium perfringens]|nr:hypothetical protein [Clostridium perfringens]